MLHSEFDAPNLRSVVSPDAGNGEDHDIMVIHCPPAPLHTEGKKTNGPVLASSGISQATTAATNPFGNGSAFTEASYLSGSLPTASGLPRVSEDDELFCYPCEDEDGGINNGGDEEDCNDHCFLDDGQCDVARAAVSDDEGIKDLCCGVEWDDNPPTMPPPQEVVQDPSNKNKLRIFRVGRWYFVGKTIPEVLLKYWGILAERYRGPGLIMDCCGDVTALNGAICISEDWMVQCEVDPHHIADYFEAPLATIMGDWQSQSSLYLDHPLTSWKNDCRKFCMAVKYKVKKSITLGMKLHFNPRRDFYFLNRLAFYALEFDLTNFGIKYAMAENYLIRKITGVRPSDGPEALSKLNDHMIKKFLKPKLWRGGDLLNQTGSMEEGSSDCRKLIATDQNVKVKTAICRHWKAGLCAMRDNCRFAHGAHELVTEESMNARKKKMVWCRDWVMHRVCNDPSCGKAHSDEEFIASLSYGANDRYRLCRFWSTGICKNGDNCRFFHLSAAEWRERTKIWEVAECTPVHQQNKQQPKIKDINTTRSVVTKATEKNDVTLSFDSATGMYDIHPAPNGNASGRSGRSQQMANMKKIRSSTGGAATPMIPDVGVKTSRSPNGTVVVHLSPPAPGLEVPSSSSPPMDAAPGGPVWNKMPTVVEEEKKGMPTLLAEAMPPGNQIARARVNKKLTPSTHKTVVKDEQEFHMDIWKEIVMEIAPDEK